MIPIGYLSEDAAFSTRGDASLAAPAEYVSFSSIARNRTPLSSNIKRGNIYENTHGSGNHIKSSSYSQFHTIRDNSEVLRSAHGRNTPLISTLPRNIAKSQTTSSVKMNESSNYNFLSTHHTSKNDALMLQNLHVHEMIRSNMESPEKPHNVTQNLETNLKLSKSNTSYEQANLNPHIQAEIIVSNNSKTFDITPLHTSIKQNDIDQNDMFKAYKSTLFDLKTNSYSAENDLFHDTTLVNDNADDDEFWTNPESWVRNASIRGTGAESIVESIFGKDFMHRVSHPTSSSSPLRNATPKHEF